MQHTILLWPFHLLIVAVAIAQLPLRWAGALTIVLCFSNLAVTCRYYSDLVRNGPAIRWTDAIDPLKQYLSASKAQRILIADWGVIETLSLLSEGKLPVYSADVRDSETLNEMIANPDQIFVSHAAEFTFVPGIRSRLDEQARNNGFKEEPIAVISDSHARPTFEIFGFRSSGEGK